MFPMDQIVSQKFIDIYILSFLDLKVQTTYSIVIKFF